MHLPSSLLLIPFACAFAFEAVQAGAGFTGKKVIAGYWPSYGDMTTAQVPYKAYTHLDYFVFVTTSDPTAIDQFGEPDSKIFDFVQRAHAAGITTSYVVGGWTGSKYFSTHVATASSRNTFANTLVATMNKFGFDGIDIDWEYPGSQGIGDNVVSPNDATNFGLFLQTLRAIVPNARLSMAASIAGITGPNGAKVSDLSVWASALDYLTVMSYDIYGPWMSTTGPNGPLYDTCSTAEGKLSADRTIQYYVSAGFSRSHILLGFPAYSYVSTVVGPLTSRTCPDGTVSLLYQEKRTSATCGTWVGDGGQLLYRDLVNRGYFPLGRTRSDWRAYTDQNSKTSLLYNDQQGLFIPTETISTAKTKAIYCGQQGLGGINTFSIDGDTSDLQLVNAQRTGLRMQAATPVVSTSRREKRGWLSQW